MKSRLIAAAALACGAILAAGAPAHADVTVGTYTSGNCYPFSCFASDDFNGAGGGIVFQQQYNAAAFSGPLTVQSITFFRDSGTVMDDATYDVSFYIGPAMGAMDVGDFNNNRGTLLVNFGSFHFSGTMPTELTLDGADFNYNPADGNLLMDVTVTALNEGVGYQSFFQADYSGNGDILRSYYYNNSAEDTANDDGAIVTRFNTGAVPEPGTWALMIGGFGLAGASLRRRRTAAT